MLLGRQSGQPIGDDLLAVGGVDQDAVREQRFLPVGRGGDGEGARGVEAVALGQVAAGQAVAVIGAVAQIERDDLAVEQADDAAQRADPDEAAGAAPAHGFRPGEAAQQAGHGAGDQVGGGDGFGALFQHPVVALLAKLVAPGVVLAQKADQRLFRGGGAGAALGGAGGGDFGGDLGAQGDAAGTEPGGNVGWCDRRPGRRSTSAFKLGRRAALHARRDFLAEQFDKEFRHRVSP